MSYSSHWLDCFQLNISARKLNDPQPVAKNQEQQDGLTCDVVVEKGSYCMVFVGFLMMC